VVASSIRVPKKSAVFRPSGAAPEGLTGMAELRPLFPGGAGGEGGEGGGRKAVAFHSPQALSSFTAQHKKQESLSCARGQVVIARILPVLTPPWRYGALL
jgi:hypothetical protein